MLLGTFSSRSRLLQRDKTFIYMQYHCNKDPVSMLSLFCYLSFYSHITQWQCVIFLIASQCSASTAPFSVTFLHTDTKLASK